MRCLTKLIIQTSRIGPTFAVGALLASGWEFPGMAATARGIVAVAVAGQAYGKVCFTLG